MRVNRKDNTAYVGVSIVLRLFGSFNYEETMNNEFIDFSYLKNIKADAENFSQLDDFSIAK
ncbi:hypothetical protein [Lewinella sp. LCG006]|uniref:hypothetical protein n=1 Tax=Lewinella sp. LCG006 TaxID=3231911 RepID=UPI00345FD4BA